MSAIGAIVLAAGMSKRMGQPKLLLPFIGKPLFRHCVDAAAAAGLKPIILVGGYRMQELLQHAADLPEIEVIPNEDYESGMASSLRIGMAALTGRADAALVCLADQPLVPGIVMNKIRHHYDLHRKEGIRIIRPEYNGTLGHPILFDAELFPEFEHIQGDEGGKSILAKHQSRLRILPFQNAEWGYDVDTADDLAKLEKIAQQEENGSIRSKCE